MRKYGRIQVLPKVVYDSEQRGSHDNITSWALDQFQTHYAADRGKKAAPITKDATFNYVYGVLHGPVYREKYVFNLKREFPRIPFYNDFWQWLTGARS